MTSAAMLLDVRSLPACCVVAPRIHQWLGRLGAVRTRGRGHAERVKFADPDEFKRRGQSGLSTRVRSTTDRKVPEGIPAEPLFDPSRRVRASLWSLIKVGTRNSSTLGRHGGHVRAIALRSCYSVFLSKSLIACHERWSAAALYWVPCSWLLGCTWSVKACITPP